MTISDSNTPEFESMIGGYKTKMEIVSNVATALLIILGIVSTALATSDKHRDAAIWVGFAASVAGCLWFCSWLQDHLWKSDTEKKGSAAQISVTYGWTQNSGEHNPTLWLVSEKQRTALYAAFEYNFTNIGPSPIMVNSAVIEKQRDDGTWFSISPPFGTAHGRIFHGGKPDNVIEVRYQTLDAAFAHKNIGPGETVKGWVFLTSPPLKGRMRFTIMDTRGRKMSAVPEDHGHVGFPVVSANFEAISPRVDISSLPVVPSPN